MFLLFFDHNCHPGEVLLFIKCLCSHTLLSLDSSIQNYPKVMTYFIEAKGKRGSL